MRAVLLSTVLAVALAAPSFVAAQAADGVSAKPTMTHAKHIKKNHTHVHSGKKGALLEHPATKPAA